MRSVPRCYKRDKLGSAVSQSVERRLGGWREMAARLGVRQSVRTSRGHCWDPLPGND
jgi:hypothetical protein